MLRILLLNADYPVFLRWFYRNRPTLLLRSFAAQLAARNASLFGTADFMSFHIKSAGHDAIDVHVNNRPLQEAWLARYGSSFAAVPHVFRSRPLVLRPDEQRFWDILETQIRAYKPNVIYNHEAHLFAADRLDVIKPPGCRLIAQIAAPLNPGIQWKYYDLVVSSLPNYVEAFRRQGIASAYLPLAFDARVLDHVAIGGRDIPLSFVGSLFDAHGERRAMLERIARQVPIDIWGQGVEELPPDSAIPVRHKGMAWGKAMYGVLARSRISLNKHIDISENYANNMRLFEATGMGCLLVTDWKENLGEMFEPGKEVVTYRDAEECVDKLRFYLAPQNEPARARIMSAGQRRTLTEHTYHARMRQLLALLDA